MISLLSCLIHSLILRMRRKEEFRRDAIIEMVTTSIIHIVLPITKVHIVLPITKVHIVLLITKDYSAYCILQIRIIMVNRLF